MPGRMADAVAEYQTALRIDPQLSGGAPQSGTCLYVDARPSAGCDRGVSEGASRSTRRRLQSEPNLWEAHFNLGLAYAQMAGREADAIAEYQTALRMKPDSALAHFHLGNTFHKMGRLPDAIAEYQASLSIDPDVPEVHYELAYALAQIPGRVPEAIAECRKMLLLKPGDEPGRQLIGVVIGLSTRPRGASVTARLIARCYHRVSRWTV